MSRIARQAYDATHCKSDSLSIVVFTCGPLGFEAAKSLSKLPEVSSVRIIYGPYSKVRRSGLDRVRHLLRYNTPARLFKRGIVQLARTMNRKAPGEGHLSHCDHVLYFPDFNSGECASTIEALNPDLGVVVGTYILKPSIFRIPRRGSINLHTGKAPQYRGAAPAFWEMYNADSEVGITVHWVADEVDAGGILRQESFPFDSAPSGDPLKYIEQYRKTVLEPNGIRMLVEVVAAIAQGIEIAIPQDESVAHVYRRPDRRQVAELKRRVAQRRKAI